MTNVTTDSVTFSLAELAQIESQRLREEEAARVGDRERAARARREAEAREAAAEATRIAEDEERRAKLAREEALDRTRAQAREQATRDVARIEAEARARLEIDDAARAHELAVLRVRGEAGATRTTVGLACLLVLSLFAAGLGASRYTGRIAAVEQQAEALRDGQAALVRERDEARAAALAVLDRRATALAAHPLAGAVADARRTVEAARAAVDTKTPDHARLRAFGDAIEALAARLGAAERMAALDRRHADLIAWAGSARLDALGAASAAGDRARASMTEESLKVYDRSLDEIVATLDRKAPVRRDARRDDKRTTTGAAGTCREGDPMCGLDGRPL